MASWMKFSLLWLLTGSPVTAALILLALWALADWYTVGFLRRGWRLVQNARRGARLADVLEVNPHDRKARADLAEILVEQRRYARALEVVKPAVDQDPGDRNGLFLLGLACLGAGRVEQGEIFLGEVIGAEPAFRRGEALFRLGKLRLAGGRHREAAEALGRYLEQYPASVEARYLLSKALAAGGDAAGARRERARAWNEYRVSLPYEKRRDRLWAWRANPSRPLTYALVLAIVLAAGGAALRRAGPLPTRDVDSASLQDE